MAKHSHLAKASDGPQAPVAEETYPVGYRRPPTHTRVKPGQVLPGGGRPKGQRNVRTVVRKTLNERIKIREGSRTRSVTKLDALILNMVNTAVAGNAKAQANLINLLRTLGLTAEPPETTHEEPLTANDEGLIADFLERNRNKPESTELSESPTQPEREKGKHKETKS